MNHLPPCPKCHSEYTYQEHLIFICPECAYEWHTADVEDPVSDKRVLDAHGTPLQEGDSVTLIKDLKVKGSSSVIKIGTKVNNIRLVEGDHDIDCKIVGLGAMKLKSAFVKKT